MTQETLVLGGGPTGLELATGLEARGRTVTLVDDGTTVDRARAAGLTVHESTLDTAVSAAEQSAATVVVATPCDARNLLLAGAAPRTFDADRVVALVHDPENRTAFEDAGIETICVATALAGATTDAVDPDGGPTTGTANESAGTATPG